MKHYGYAIAALVLVALIFGFIGPFLVSAKATELVLGGIALVIIAPVLFYYLYRFWSSSKEGKKVMRSMKKIVPMLLLAILIAGCSKVPAGHVGVVVNQYGSDKGVSEREVGVGSYWLSWNEVLFTFPTFQQTDTWAKADRKDESIPFQTGKDGMVMNADFGITFEVDPKKVTKLFQTYRRGIDEISDIFLRNLVRDAVNEFAAEYSADEVYGRKKNELMDRVEASVIKAVADKGIIVQKVYLIGEIRLPQQVKQAIDEKNRALQTTLQREQEIIKAKAEAEIKIAEARGRAESVLLEAKAQAEANQLLAKSLTPELLQGKALEKWNGELPRLTGGGAIPFININPDTTPQKPSGR